MVVASSTITVPQKLRCASTRHIHPLESVGRYIPRITGGNIFLRHFCCQLDFVSLVIPSSQYFIDPDTHKSRLVSVALFLWIPFEALVRCKTYTMEAIRKMIDDGDVGVVPQQVARPQITVNSGGILFSPNGDGSGDEKIA